MPEVTETSADSIVGDLIKTHPEVRPNAVLAENKNAAAVQRIESAPVSSKPTPEKEVFKDKAGEIFKKDKHYADKYGRPQTTPGGYFRKIPIRKRLKRQAMEVLGRSNESEESEEVPKASDFGNTESEKASEPASEARSEAQRESEPEIRSDSYIPPERESASPGNQPADEFRAAAKALCSTIFTIGVSVGGTACKPLPQHVESMEQSWEQYFRQKGKIDVPPGVAVALSTGGYALFCYQSSQQVQQQASGIRSWIVRKIGNWKTNRAAKRASRKGDAE